MLDSLNPIETKPEIAEALRPGSGSSWGTLRASSERCRCRGNTRVPPGDSSFGSSSIKDLMPKSNVGSWSPGALRDAVSKGRRER